MKTYTEGELNEILRKHKLWLANDPSGERADLTGADLTRANLWGADLTRANLRGANLWGADLTGADLTRANLWGADLTGADLTGADLTGADLTRANLWGADLTRANLWGADLTRANLRGANLWGADLTGADLTRANLRGANLWGADLTRADLTGADLTRANLWGADLTRANLWGADPKDATNVTYPIACPEEGSFIGFKKCRNNLIVKLEIPEDALRCSASSRKCKCSKAKVISITNIDGTDAEVDIAISGHDSDFAYRVGETVSVNNFDENRWHECAPGIHFFVTRQEAVEY